MQTPHLGSRIADAVLTQGQRGQFQQSRQDTSQGLCKLCNDKGARQHSGESEARRFFTFLGQGCGAKLLAGHRLRATPSCSRSTSFGSGSALTSHASSLVRLVSRRTELDICTQVLPQALNNLIWAGYTLSPIRFMSH